MKVSNTYRRGRMKSSANRLYESSSDLIDYRSRLVYVNLRLKHPSWHPSVVKAIASNKALFVTIFQAPLEWISKARMKIRLILMKLTIKRKRNDTDKRRG